MGPAAVVAFPTSVMAIQPQDLIEQGIEEIDAEYRKRILLKTRNSELLTQDPTFHRDYTYLTPEGADYLVKYGVQLVGIDYLSIEQFRSGHHRTHRTLLEHNVVIVEGLKLDGVPPGVYELRCLPLRIKGCDGAPARAVLLEVS
jgi:arylformamidase